MSAAIFPSLPGVAWPKPKAPIWSTKVQQAVSGRELRAAFRQYPIYKFTLTHDFLRGGAEQEFQTLIGFFNARKGSWDSFLYADPADNAVAAQSFGTGNGATTQFQLVRTFGGDIEPVMNLNGNPAIYKAGVLQTAGTHYTVSNGLITFATAPANGNALTWTGGYYYRCRFERDSEDFEGFLQDLWSLKKISFFGSLGRKL